MVGIRLEDGAKLLIGYFGPEEAVRYARRRLKAAPDAETRTAWEAILKDVKRRAHALTHPPVLPKDSQPANLSFNR